MNQLKLINPENVSEEELKNFKVREAVRAVVIDKDNKIALLYVSKENYYKLPGGGIESSENQAIALERECKEEIGCNVEVLNEIGFIVEYRKIHNLKQVSYCYLAKVKGEKGISDFTDEEKNHGFKQIWLPYEEALKILTETKATSVEGNDYIVPRDITFLKEAKLYLNSIIN